MTRDSEAIRTQEQRLQEVLADYLREVEAGRAPDQAELLARHPDLAAELQDFIAGQEQLGRLAAPLRQVVEPTLGDGITGTLGDFRIVREVGRGGMGIVYEAEQISLRRPVALKVLPFAATMDTRHLQRFHNEAQAAACLHHTNIVPVHFVGSERGVHFYAMQFIDGQPLSEIIRQLRRTEKPESAAAREQNAADQTPPDAAIVASATIRPVADATPLTSEGRRGRDYYRKVAELGVQAAEALDYAHQLGIVHRDIKPGNLILDGTGRLWVTDFGLAHMQHGEATLTLTGQALGTPRYMSPEQALAKCVPIDHRTDVYSLGVTLYELLALRPAFTSEDRHELLRQIAFEEPAKPRRLERTIPAELETIVLKAMEKRPQDRYATAQELADDLRHWLEYKPIRAKRPSWVQVARKWARRHRVVVGSTIVILASACLFLAGSISWIAGEHSARRSAIERVVEEALNESFKSQGAHDWSNARSAGRRAVMLSVGGEINADLHRRVCERENDLTLLDDLDHLPMPDAPAYTDARVHLAFERWGIDLDKVQLEEAVSRIKGSAVRYEIIRALDIWGVVRLYTQGAQDQKGLLLLRIARAVDSNVEHNRFRTTLQDGGSKFLLDLCKPEIARRLIPESQYYIFSYVIPKDVSALLEYQRRHPGDRRINLLLGNLFAGEEPPRCDEAIRFFTAALALCLPYDDPNGPSNEYHKRIGWMMERKGDVIGAIAEYGEVLHTSRFQDLWTVERLGDLLIRLCNIDAAIAMYQKAIESIEGNTHLGHNQPFLHCLLGHGLRRKMLYKEALAEYRRGHESSLGLLESSGTDPDPCAPWIYQGERLREFDTKLSHVLEGKAQPANAEECLQLARTCLLYEKFNVSAARLFIKAFSEQPPLADNLQEQDRYKAACAAVLAGCGQGKDADKLDAKERARLRQQALDWLRADLRAYGEILEKSAGKASPMIARRMAKWHQDRIFDGGCADAPPVISLFPSIQLSNRIGVRGSNALAELPEGERKEWQKLWDDVESLRQRAAEQR